jgi:hypothetical protein
MNNYLIVRKKTFPSSNKTNSPLRIITGRKRKAEVMEDLDEDYPANKIQIMDPPHQQDEADKAEMQMAGCSYVSGIANGSSKNKTNSSKKRENAVKREIKREIRRRVHRNQQPPVPCSKTLNDDDIDPFSRYSFSLSKYRTFLESIWNYRSPLM